MSTKNVARTVIEGGRSTRYKMMRDQANRAARHEANASTRRMVYDPDVYDEDPEIVEEIPVGCSQDEKHADKTKPALRLLHSRVGKGWNKTNTMLRDRFDDRTTAGRHVLHDHMFAIVGQASYDHRRYQEFEVDSHGVLRRDRRGVFDVEWNPNFVKGFDYQTCAGWLKGQKIAYVGKWLHWYRHPTPREVRSRAFFGWDGRLLHDVTRLPLFGNAGYGGAPDRTPFVQGDRLSIVDARHFFRLPLGVQREILANSKIAANDLWPL